MSPWKRAGFTLIEVVISAALMALILVSAYLCLSAGFKAQKMIEPRAEIIQNARVAMNIMTADLRGACPLSPDDNFLGMTRTIGNLEAGNVDFGTHNYTPHHANEGDFCEESFYLDADPTTGQLSLWRRRNPAIALDPLNGGSKEEIATGVAGLQFEYFDGLDWYPTWGEVKENGKDASSNAQASNLTGLPAAVRITLSLAAEPVKKKSEWSTTEEPPPAPPFVFQTVVCLNLAGAVPTSSGSTDSSASTGTGTGTGGVN
ncbi:MAG TPA: prepilin-type N-terminal cleavage/methylation domain-containing protein [Verrucomicrobiae bacterium]